MHYVILIQDALHFLLGLPLNFPEKCQNKQIFITTSTCNTATLGRATSGLEKVYVPVLEVTSLKII